MEHWTVMVTLVSKALAIKLSPNILSYKYLVLWYRSLGTRLDRKLAMKFYFRQSFDDKILFF